MINRIVVFFVAFISGAFVVALEAKDIENLISLKVFNQYTGNVTIESGDKHLLLVQTVKEFLREIIPGTVSKTTLVKNEDPLTLKYQGTVDGKLRININSYPLNTFSDERITGFTCHVWLSKTSIILSDEYKKECKKEVGPHNM